jgi:hypothetical protein
VRQPTRMEWASPLLHVAMNLHLSEDKEDKEDGEFWSKEGLLTEDQIDELWENGNATYWKCHILEMDRF